MNTSTLPSESTDPRQSREGFTVIELLAVIAVIALLVLLITPAVIKGNAAAEQAKCASNMKQIHTFMNLYLADHDGRYPDFDQVGGGSKTQWRQSLYDYTGNPIDDAGTAREVWQCPSRKYGGGVTDWQRYIDYGGNSNLRNDIMFTLPDPANTILIIDCNAGTGYHSRKGVSERRMREWVQFRHKDKTTNMLFCDGHVGMAKESELTTRIMPAFHGD